MFATSEKLVEKAGDPEHLVQLYLLKTLHRPTGVNPVVRSILQSGLAWIEFDSAYNSAAAHGFSDGGKLASRFINLGRVTNPLTPTWCSLQPALFAKRAESRLEQHIDLGSDWVTSCKWAHEVDDRTAEMSVPEFTVALSYWFDLVACKSQKDVEDFQVGYSRQSASRNNFALSYMPISGASSAIGSLPGILK